MTYRAIRGSQGDYEIKGVTIASHSALVDPRSGAVVVVVDDAWLENAAAEINRRVEAAREVVVRINGEYAGAVSDATVKDGKLIVDFYNMQPFAVSMLTDGLGMNIIIQSTDGTARGISRVDLVRTTPPIFDIPRFQTTVE